MLSLINWSTNGHPKYQQLQMQLKIARSKHITSRNILITDKQGFINLLSNKWAGHTTSFYLYFSVCVYKSDDLFSVCVQHSLPNSLTNSLTTSFYSYVPGCVYKSVQYQQGQFWDDGCQYKCECVDATRGQYRCTEKYVMIIIMCMYSGISVKRPPGIRTPSIIWPCFIKHKMLYQI